MYALADADQSVVPAAGQAQQLEFFYCLVWQFTLIVKFSSCTTLYYDKLFELDITNAHRAKSRVLGKITSIAIFRLFSIPNP